MPSEVAILKAGSKHAPKRSGGATSSQERIVSLDQFRGYSVAAMFVVNFLGGLAVTHHLLKHNNTHFSYADSIMPSFIFACGFSYRMSVQKRFATSGAAGVRSKFVGRSLGLILLSLILTAFNGMFVRWSEMSAERVQRFAAELVKANMWEVLAIIGALQILLLPVIAARPLTRAMTALVLCAAHVFLSWSFNYEFVYGRPNWLDPILGTVGKRAWDGGVFGLMSWAEIMLAGTLASDMVHRQGVRQAAANLVRIGVGLMLVGYAISCLTTLYDVPPGAESSTSAALASSPVLPDVATLHGRAWQSLLAEPPFVPPPPPDKRMPNYWAMDKRVVTQSFTLFASGFVMALYGVFVWLCDIRRGSWKLFTVFGQNALAAYIIHHFVVEAILALVPKDAPLAWVLVGLSTFFAITYFFVRYLSDRQLFLRL